MFEWKSSQSQTDPAPVAHERILREPVREDGVTPT
jgi:hypothetical protein